MSRPASASTAVSACRRHQAPVVQLLDLGANAHEQRNAAAGREQYHGVPRKLRGFVVTCRRIARKTPVSRRRSGGMPTQTASIPKGECATVQAAAADASESARRALSSPARVSKETGTGGSRGYLPIKRSQAARRRVAKRGLDLVGGLVLSTLTLPVVVVLLAMSAWSFRAFPLFTHQRIGKHGRTFTVVKIRSLPRDVDRYVDKYSLRSRSTTRFGRYIRRTHLDEIPQFWLAVLGSMSLVGPRPEMPALHEAFSEVQRQARSPFRPGCTGLWQISPDAVRLMGEVPEYDVFYLEHQSLVLDLWILWRTACVYVLRRPVSLRDVPSWAVHENRDILATVGEVSPPV